jgi:hypothetical protein
MSNKKPTDYNDAFNEGVYYKISAATDVATTWRKHGWVPPSELPEYRRKWDKAQERTKVGTR